MPGLKINFYLFILLFFGNQSYHCKVINDPFVLPFGPKAGDMLNFRDQICSLTPFPLDMDLKFGTETFSHAHICKGGMISFTNNQAASSPNTFQEDDTFFDNSITAFNLHVNAPGWYNYFADYMCSQVYEFQNTEAAQRSEKWDWADLGTGFPYDDYFYLRDPIYYYFCTEDNPTWPVSFEDLTQMDDLYAIKHFIDRYGWENPSLYATKSFHLTGNVLKRVDRSEETLQVITSLIRQLPGKETFEATWSFIVTWFRTPLATNWEGWLSQQTIVTCEEGGSPEDSLCFVIWNYEMVQEVATEPEDTISVDIGMKMQGAFTKFPLSQDAGTLMQGSNVGIPGLYVFDITGDVPIEPSYPGVSLGICDRSVTPNESPIFSRHTLFTLKGFFCDSEIPQKKEIEIVFEGQFSSSSVQPVRVDRQSGDVLAYFPFWGVVETAVLYLVVNGTEKRQSTMQIDFFSNLDRFGFPPFLVLDDWNDISVDSGLPQDFVFYSENMLIRSVILKDLPTTQSGGITVDKEWLGTNAVVVNVASPTHEYQLLLMNEDFKEFNPKSSTTSVEAKVQVIVNSSLSCEDWISKEQQLQGKLTHCLKRFEDRYDNAAGGNYDYTCPGTAHNLFENNLERLVPGWHEDPCCSFSTSDQFKEAMKTSGVCDHCEFRRNEDTHSCFFSDPYPCRPGEDTSQELLFISKKCCYDTNKLKTEDDFISWPAFRHEFANHYKLEIEPWKACCKDETSCDVYHDARLNKWA